MSNRNAFLAKYSKSAAIHKNEKVVNEILEKKNHLMSMNLPKTYSKLNIASGLRYLFEKGFYLSNLDKDLYDNLFMIYAGSVDGIEIDFEKDPETAITCEAISLLSSPINDLLNFTRSVVVESLPKEHEDAMAKMSKWFSQGRIGLKTESDEESNFITFLLGCFYLNKNYNFIVWLSGQEYKDVMFCFLTLWLRSDTLPDNIKQETFNYYINVVNKTLDMDLEITVNDFSNMPDNDMQQLLTLIYDAEMERLERGETCYIDTGFSNEEIFNKACEAIRLKKQNGQDNSDNTLLLREQQEPKADSKASSAILNFFDSNSNTLIAKLKDSGLQLSAAALQNDQNITRVANVVYNLLPGMVRIFVSFDTVENFLLENRQWLINKLV